MMIAFLFGSIGGLILIIKKRIELGFEDISESKILRQEERHRLFLGGFLGLISHLVIQSKFIIKLLYPSLSLEKVDISFVGLAIIAIASGFFAEKVLGFADKQVDKVVKKQTKDEQS